MIARPQGVLLAAILGFSVTASTVESAVPDRWEAQQDRFAQTTEPPAAADTARPAKSLEGYRLQELDDPLTRHIPAEPRSAEKQKQLDALAWYMTGRLREQRNDFRGAMAAYEQAIEIDSEAAEAYRALVPLAFGSNQTEKAVEYARKAVELFPNDHQLLRRLGVHLATQRKLPEAIQFLEKAAASTGLEKQSAFFVMLMRDLAVLYGLSGKAEKAADCYETVYDALINPDKYNLDFRERTALIGDPTTTYERIGEAFLDADRPDAAVRAFEQAAEARQGKPGTLSFNLARVYLETGSHEKALDRLQEYFDAQLQSKGRKAYQLLADILDKMGRSEELIPRLEALAKVDARNSTLQFFLAERYVLADRLDEAEQLYKKTLETSGDPVGYFGLAVVYRRQHQPEALIENLAQALSKGGDPEALQTELKAIAEDQAFFQAVIAAGQKFVEADPAQRDFAKCYVLAELGRQGEDNEAAVEFYCGALAARKDRSLLEPFAENLNDFVRDLLVESHYALAAQVLEDAAAESSLAALRVNFLYLLAQARELNGETEAALASVAEAKKIVNHPQLSFQEAWIYYHSQQWDEAVKRFEQFIAEFPQEQETIRRCQFIISNIYVQKGEMRKGEEILEKILAEDPDDPSVNNDLGYLYADQGKNLEQAEKMIRKAVAAEPENPAYLDSLGWVLYKLGKFEEALPHLQKAAETLEGGDATIWDHLGDCYNRLNRPKEAREAWDKALKAAGDERRPDKKLIGRIEEKLENLADSAGKLQPERPGDP